MTLPSWDCVASWRVPVFVATWEAADPWTASLAAISAAERAELARLRRAWDTALEDLGGDPLATDWSTFAPLRRDREEDWSAWLAQLLADSTTGFFAADLFGSIDARDRASHGLPSVFREVVVGDRRADIVVEWTDRRYLHIEVKVGDPHLEKTPDTAAKLRRAQSHCVDGCDVLLVLPEQTDAWDRLIAASPEVYAGIHLLTWRDVAVSLRRALVARERESLRWRVWAHAFVGAIEQELLGLASGPRVDAWCRAMRLPAVRAANDLLSNGLSRSEP